MNEVFMKAGELIMFSKGEYSDYHILGSFVILEDITVAEMREAVKRTQRKIEEAHEERNKWFEENRTTIAINKFTGDRRKETTLPPSVEGEEILISTLIRNGKLLSINHREIHLWERWDKHVKVDGLDE